jgi:glycosyltransferase involved in cell wall biosynthesis
MDKDAPLGAPRVALFLGRIYPVKGLPMLIEAWARVRPHGWVLRIAGPDEAGHRREVERRVSAVGLNHVVDFRGPLEGHSKESAFAEADLFVLTSYSESFGMGIAEALAHGLPVLTTTGAPWPMLPKEGCGWWVDPTVDCVTEGLRQATSLNSESLREMGEKGRALVTAEFSWKSVAARMLTNYKKIVANDSACLN